MTQALAKKADLALIPTKGIATPVDYLEAISFWSDNGLNVISAETVISEFDPDHRPSVSVVRFNPDPDGPDCYHSKLFHGSNEVSPSLVALNKIAAAAAIDWEETRRTDDRSIQHLWAYTVRGRYVTPAGDRIALVASCELDLRDGAPKAAACRTSAQLQAMRAQGNERAESGAKARAVRSLGLPHKMTKAQFAKPFIIVKTSLRPRDPETRRLMHLGASGALYGRADGRTSGALPERVIDASVVEESPQTTDAPPPAADSATPADQVQEDPLFVMRKVGRTAKAYYVLVEGREEPLWTADKASAMALKAAFDAGKKSVRIHAGADGEILEHSIPDPDADIPFD